MGNADDEPSRPRTFTVSNVWEAVDRFRDETNAKLDRVITETREARHSQANLTQRAIHEQGQTLMGEIGGLDTRLRSIENSLAAAAPVSLGARINELEMWRSKSDGESSLPARVNAMESNFDQMRGSMTSLKVVGAILGVLNAAVLLWAGLMGGQMP